MKNVLKFLFVATLAVFFLNTSFAQTTKKALSDKATTGTTVQGKFVDRNNDGICDNHDAKGKTNCCANFVDKDANGVCDNNAKKDYCYKNANGQGHNKMNSAGCGQGSCQGKGQGKCCPNKQGTPNVTPAETPDPKK